MSILRIALVLTLGASAVAACSSEPTCDYSKVPYRTATSVAPLKAPEGLTAPDRTAALVIPPAPAQSNVASVGKGKCLDRPPSYFSTTTTPRADTAEKKPAEK